MGYGTGQDGICTNLSLSEGRAIGTSLLVPGTVCEVEGWIGEMKCYGWK